MNITLSFSRKSIFALVLILLVFGSFSLALANHDDPNIVHLCNNSSLDKR